MHIQQLKPVAVERNQYGFWNHPEWKNYFETQLKGTESLSIEQIDELHRYFNIETARVYFESDADADLFNRFYENQEYAAVKEWQPSKPDQDLNWFLASIFENSQGDVIAIWAKFKKLYRYEICLEEERQAFERNFIECGGTLAYLEWNECDDECGTYQPDWETIQEAEIDDHEFDEMIMDRAERTTICLMAWLECAKSKTIPKGYVLVPSEPTDRQKQVAAELLHSTNDHLAIYKALVATAQW